MKRYRTTPSTIMGNLVSSRVATNLLWRSLAVFNGFRQLVVVGLAASLLFFAQRLAIPYPLYPLAFIACGCYALITLAFTAGIMRRWPHFDIQLTVQVAVDVVFIVAIMHFAGGLKSGLGMLLLPYLAVAGLIAHGRMTLFHAALATLALLSEESWRAWRGGDVDFVQVALFCSASFAVAWLAHRLARHAQDNLRLAEQRGVDLANLGQLNQRILQDVSEGVLVVDGRNRVRQFNERVLQLTGVRPQIDAPLADGLPALALLLADWRQNPKRELPPLELPMLRKTLRARCVAISPGTKGNVLIYIENLEMLRKEAQKLKLAALGRLTASLAHEIRNPLSAVTQAAELLTEDPLARDPGSARLLRIIGDNAARLENLVKDILALNRRDRLAQQSIDLASWLPEFLDECCRVRGITIRPRLDCPADALVLFDINHLHQVLWNLVNNGWRYCQKQEGSQRIRVRQTQRRWQIEVWNDGPPIAPETLRHLFEPFFTTEVRGTGLGLYIAREICEANHAQITYEAPPEGGACFRITFGVDHG